MNESFQPGDVVEIDFGVPVGSAAGYKRPAVVVTAQAILRARPRTIQVVPVTTNVHRALPFELRLEPGDSSGLAQPSAAQAHLITTVDRQALTGKRYGNVGPVALRSLLELLSDLLDVPIE